MSGRIEGSTGSGSGLKHLCLKLHSKRLEEPEIEIGIPGDKASGLSTPHRFYCIVQQRKVIFFIPGYRSTCIIETNINLTASM